MSVMKVFHEWNLNRKQRNIDKLYEWEGLTDTVLDKQIALNEERRKLDIPDTKELNEYGFSQ